MTVLGHPLPRQFRLRRWCHLDNKYVDAAAADAAAREAAAHAQAPGSAADDSGAVDDGGFDDYDYEPPCAPVSQGIPMHASDEAWLRDSFRASKGKGATRVLEVRSDGTIANTVILSSPHYHLTRRVLGAEAVPRDDSQQIARCCPLALIKVKLLYFSESAYVCCSCGNAGCERSSNVRELFSREISFPEKQRQSYEAVFGDNAALCRCAQACIEAIWGRVGDADDIDEDGQSFCSWYREQEPGRAIYMADACVALTMSMSMTFCGPGHMLQHIQSHASYQCSSQGSTLNAVRFCAVAANMSVEVGGRQYRVAHAPNPGPPKQEWGVLRRVHESASGDSWECTVCERARLYLLFVSIACNLHCKLLAVHALCCRGAQSHQTCVTRLVCFSLWRACALH